MTSKSQNNHQKIFSVLIGIGVVIGGAPWVYADRFGFIKRMLAKGLIVFFFCLDTGKFLGKLPLPLTDLGVSEIVSILRISFCCIAVYIGFNLLMKSREWGSLQEDLDEISNSFVLYPEKISWINFALIKPAFGIFFLLSVFYSWMEAWSTFDSLVISFAVLQTHFFIFLLFHILETLNWKLKEMTLIMKKSRSILTQNLISKWFFDKQIEYLLVMKRSNGNFNELCGIFILKEVVISNFDLVHDGMCTQNITLLTWLSYLIAWFALIIECDKVIYSYEKLQREINWNIQYQIFHSRISDPRKLNALIKFRNALKLHKLKFSCSGYLSLDSRLLTNMIEAIATIVIIKIQMSK